MTGLLNVFIYWPGRHNLRPKGRGFSGKIIERRRHQGTSHRRTSPANIRLDEDVLKTSFVFVFRRRLDQDEYVHLSLMSSEDVFKTSWWRPIYSSWLYVFKTSSRRLAKTSSRHLQDVFKTYYQVKVFLPSQHSSWWRRLEDVFRLRLQKTSSRRLQDVLVKTNIFVLAIRLQDVLQKGLQDIFKTSSRRIIKLNCSC